jgi:tetratricopeptide (TPR) repeat protein
MKRAPTRMRRRIAGLAMATLVAASGAMPAAAQPAPPPIEESPRESERAELFRQGTVLAEHGRWPEAADKFREVIALRSAPKALIALAVAEERQGKITSAKRTYEKAAADARSAGLNDELQRAEQGSQALAPRIPRIAIRVPPSAKSAQCWVDDAPIPIPSKGQIEVEVDPGVHSVRVEAPDHFPFRSTVRIAEAERAELDARMQPKKNAAPPVRTSKTPPLGAALVGGVGMVTLGVSFILWAAGRSQEEDVIAQCPRGGKRNDCPPELEPEADSAAAKIIVGNVLFPLGLLGMAVGGTWWLVDVSSGQAAKTSVGIGPNSLQVRRQF